MVQHMHDQSFVLDPLTFRNKNKVFEAKTSKTNVFWNKKIYFLMEKGIILVKFLFIYVQSSDKIHSFSSCKNVCEHHAKRMEKLFWKTNLFYSGFTYER